eukprot:15538198-Heterocapsa_arctica.AAC.1
MDIGALAQKDVKVKPANRNALDTRTGNQIGNSVFKGKGKGKGKDKTKAPNVYPAYYPQAPS